MYKTDSPSLPDLTREINTTIDRLELSHRTTVKEIIALGTQLQQAKAQVAHGQWLGWLSANIRISPRHAQRCMMLAEHPETAMQAATVRSAIELVSKQVSLNNMRRFGHRPSVLLGRNGDADDDQESADPPAEHYERAPDDVRPPQFGWSKQLGLFFTERPRAADHSRYREALQTDPDDVVARLKRMIEFAQRELESLEHHD